MKRYFITVLLISFLMQLSCGKKGNDGKAIINGDRTNMNLSVTFSMTNNDISNTNVMINLIDSEGIILSNQIKMIESTNDTIQIYVDTNFFDGDTISSMYVPDDGNILNTCVINLLDGNLSNTFITRGINENGEGKDVTFRFVQNYPVDKIVIYNGYQQSSNTYYSYSRPKEFGLGIYSIYIKHGEIEGIGQSGLIMKDTPKAKTFRLVNTVTNSSYWSFYFDECYYGDQYEEMAISEIEFWYDEKKYEIVNIDNWKSNFIRNRIYSKVKSITNRIREIEYPDESIFGITISNMGYDPVQYCYLHFRLETKEIYLYRGIDMFYETNYFEISFNSNKGILIGNFDFDHYGRIGIKIGDGERKYTHDTLGFSGTDIECPYTGTRWMNYAME